MGSFNRRDFLKASIAGAGLLATAPRLLRAAEPAVHFNGTDIVELGKTGIKVSRLAQGTGFNGYNHSSEHTRQGKAAFDRLLRHSLDQGISFIDMADLYGSHPFVKDVIKGLPRDKLTLLSKIWPQKDELGQAVGRGQGGGRSLPQGTRHRPSRRLPDPLHAECQVAHAIRADPRRAFRSEAEGGRAGRGRVVPRLRRVEGGCRSIPGST